MHGVALHLLLWFYTLNYHNIILFEVAEDDMDISETVLPEDISDISGAQLDTFKGTNYTVYFRLA